MAGLYIAFPDSDRIMPLETYEVWRVDENWDPSGSRDDLAHAESMGSAVLVKMVIEGKYVWKEGDGLTPPTITGLDT